MKHSTPRLSNFLYFAIILFLCCHAAVVIAGQDRKLSPFVSGSLQQIKDARPGRPFMLVMWSPECGSCRKEMDMLAETRLRNPAVDIVVVATDEGLDEEELARFLDEHRLEDIEAWYFAEPNSNKLRYEVDSTWYGEIPRTYFYDQDHQRVAISGMVKQEQIEAWLALTLTP